MTGTIDRRVRVRVLGPFGLESPDGDDLSPRGRKACGLIGILALSPGYSRPRATLQDRLWSDRGQDQGANSLRQSLTEIRKALGPYRDCLLTDNRTVSLDGDAVTVDVADTADDALLRMSIPDRPILLEGMDIRDREFEHWLRDQRHAFERRLAEIEKLAESHRQTGTSAPEPPVVSAPVSASSEPGRPWVRILPSTVTGGNRGDFYSRVISQAIARGIAEFGTAEVVNDRRETPGIDLQVEALPMETEVVVHVSLYDSHGGRLLWSGTQQVPGSEEFICNVTALQRLINQTIDIGLLQLSNLNSDNENDNAFAMGVDALQLMFSGDSSKLMQADRLLDQAFDQSEQPIMLALKAYLKTFLTGEHLSDRVSHVEETRSLLRNAIQADPYNSNILALASYIHCFVLSDYYGGHELAERSLIYNPANPLGMAFLGRAKIYLGQLEEGYRQLTRARQVAGPGPHRYTIDFLCGVAAALSGRYEEAIRLQEISRAVAPSYRAPLRYLLVLYLKLGHREKAREVFEEIRRYEPDFTLRSLRETTYPSAGLRSSGLLESSDSEFE